MVGAMREIDADIYYQSPAGAATGITAWFCRKHGKRFISRIASDLACIPGKQLIRYWRDRKIYEYGLRNADLIVAQSEQQRTLLQQNYGLKSEVLDMAVEMPSGPQPDERYRRAVGFESAAGEAPRDRAGSGSAAAECAIHAGRRRAAWRRMIISTP